METKQFKPKTVLHLDSQGRVIFIGGLCKAKDLRTKLFIKEVRK